MMHGDWGFGFAGGWLMMMVFWVLIFGLVIGGLASLFNRGSSSHSDNFDPRRIVQERYAKGEISREEYLALMNDFK